MERPSPVTDPVCEPQGAAGKEQRTGALRSCPVLVSGLLSGFDAEWILTGRGGEAGLGLAGGQSRETAWEWGNEESLGARLGVSLF